MPTVLVAGPTVTLNAPFSSLAVAITIDSTEFAYHGGMTRLSWPGWLRSNQGLARDDDDEMVTHLTTNRARC